MSDFKQVIQENIHTLPQAASWNSEGKGVSWTEILKYWGGGGGGVQL